MRLSRSTLQVCPVLPQDVQHQLLALDEAQLLHTAVTSLAFVAGGWCERLLRLGDACLGLRLVPKLLARRLPARLAPRVRSLLLAELLQRWAQKRHSGREPATTDAWFTAVDRAAARRIQSSIRLAIGREDACLSTFRAARAIGSLCLYILPTAHYATVRRVMQRENAEFPEAASHFSLSEEYEVGRCRRKDVEITTADHILVPSQYVVDSLRAAGVTAERFTMIPWGCEPKFDPRKKGKAAARRRIVLNVGNISLRKGIPRLLRAWKRLGAYRTHRLRMIGSLHLTAKFLSDYSGLFEHIPHLPRNELSRHYASADAFVFPAACEGLGVVVNEALSHGLPVVASTHSGAVGFITDGREGMIYPFGDDDKLCTTLDRVLSRPYETAEMGRAAYELAQGWTWSHYRTAYRGLVLRLLERRAAFANGIRDRESEQKRDGFGNASADEASVMNENSETT